MPFSCSLPLCSHLLEDAPFVSSERVTPLASGLLGSLRLAQISAVKHRGVLALRKQRLLCLYHIRNILDTLVIQEGLVVVLI